ncbi:MAG: TusE/DsrC/DsvC family sulfur relay protein [Pseudomonadota bacterium]
MESMKDADVNAGLNADGFMLDDSAWSRDAAVHLARLNQLGPLTEAHWKIIDFVRGYYMKHGHGPMVVSISRATGLTTRRICELFPCGIAKGAYRLAGLPRPQGCL